MFYPFLAVFYLTLVFSGGYLFLVFGISFCYGCISSHHLLAYCTSILPRQCLQEEYTTDRNYGACWSCLYLICIDWIIMYISCWVHTYYCCDRVCYDAEAFER
jgi:hypothetical protein